METLKQKSIAILVELRHHSPFTLFGALLGLIFMMVFKDLPERNLHTLFMVFHPSHVILSAFVTTSLYRIGNPKASFLKLVIIGYVGSVGIATLSDCVLPYYGENIMGISIPTHSHADHDSKTDEAIDMHIQQNNGQQMSEHDAQADQKENFFQKKLHIPSNLHLAFIEQWQIITPSALLGIVLAMFFSATKFPHAMHVLISTWASSCHIMLNLTEELTLATMAGILIVLFISVWVPCCLSDIVFPVAFTHSTCSHNHGKNNTECENTDKPEQDE